MKNKIGFSDGSGVGGAGFTDLEVFKKFCLFSHGLVLELSSYITG